MSRKLIIGLNPENPDGKYLRLKREMEYVLDYGLTNLSFDQALFLAIFKADSKHLELLKKSFPIHCHVYLSYKDPMYFLKNS